MRKAIPTDLLLRLMNATTEQYAAVAKILGCRGDGGCESGLGGDGGRGEGTAHERGRGADGFALVVRLDAEGKFEAPSQLTVFRLYCVDGYSANQIAPEMPVRQGHGDKPPAIH